MKFFNTIFGIKISLTKEMEEMASKLIENNWFRNCGKDVNFKLKYNIEQEKNVDEIEKKLTYKKDVKGFVTLDNLLIEAGRRSQLFLSLYHKNEFGNTSNKLTDEIEKRYLLNNKFDFDSIEEKFNLQYEININLFIRFIFIDILKEIYFKNIIENYPIFFIHVIDIYLEGNVIIGWLGKFGSHEVQVKDISPIEPNEGILNIF